MRPNEGERQLPRDGGEETLHGRPHPICLFYQDETLALRGRIRTWKDGAAAFRARRVPRSTIVYLLYHLVGGARRILRRVRRGEQGTYQ